MLPPTVFLPVSSVLPCAPHPSESDYAGSRLPGHLSSLYTGSSCIPTTALVVHWWSPSPHLTLLLPTPLSRDHFAFFLLLSVLRSSSSSPYGDDASLLSSVAPLIRFPMLTLPILTQLFSRSPLVTSLLLWRLAYRGRSTWLDHPLLSYAPLTLA